MAWLTDEQFRLFGADELERFERCFEAEGLELLGVVVGQQPVPDVAPQIVDRGVVEGADGRVLDGANHPFGLPVGPRVIRLGEPVLYIMFGADASEDVGDGAALNPLVVLDELNAVVGQHRVDLVGDSHEQSLEEAGGDQLRRLPVDPGEDQLGCAVDGHEQIGLAALVAQLGDVEVEVADLVGFEPLGLLAVGLR